MILEPVAREAEQLVETWSTGSSAFECEVAGDLSETLGFLRRGSVAAVVLGAGLADDERERAAKACRQTAPQVGLLALLRSGAEPPSVAPMVTASVTRDRQALGAAVTRAIAQGSALAPPSRATGHAWPRPRDGGPSEAWKRHVAYLEAALDNVAEAVMITDPGGLIVYVNPVMERLSGYSRDELIGAMPNLIRSGLHSRAFYHRLWQTIRAGRVWREEITNRHRDGSLYSAEMTITPVDDEAGEQAMYVCRLIPVAGPARIPEERHRAVALETLGLLAGGVAHDFNNILQVVQGFCELLTERIGEQHELERVMGAVKDGAALIRQLLAFSRCEPGEPKPLDLNEVVEGLLPMLRRTVGEHIRLRTDLSPHARPAFLGSVQAQQVLVNLVLNARDAMPSGGELEIATRAVDADDPRLDELPDPAPHGAVLLRIADTGCGMTAEVLERVFDPYFSTKAPGRGTGLGLPMIHGVLRQAGGAIRIDSDPGVGTRVTVLVPATDQAVGEQLPLVDRAVPFGRGETVLLVEDLAPLREAVAMLLTSHGYQVIQAADGADALAAMKLRGAPVDVVITDVVMPHLSGPALVRELRQLGLAERFVFTSGYAEHESVGDDLADELSRVLQKPFRLEEILSRLREELAA